MKIAIDISQVIYKTGVSVYTQFLVENLLRLDKENEYILFGGSLRRIKELKDFVKKLAKDFRFKEKIFLFPPTFSDLVWNKLRIMPIESLIGNIDVLHSSDWSQPPTSAFKVTTVHDLAPLLFPRLTPQNVLYAHLRRLELVKKEADRIICPSFAIKKDLIDFGIKEEKIRVIPEAATHFKAFESSVERVKKKYSIHGKYLISVGVSPRKNTERVIRAFEQVKPQKDLKLVLVGRPTFIESIAARAIEETRGVRILGSIPDHDLSPLYTGAEALVFPSLYEGFGLPVLDAFSCEIPVVTTQNSSLSEVSGKAAVLVDPEDVDSISEGIRRALKNKKELVRRGKKRLKDFSWQKTAFETLKVYQQAKKTPTFSRG